MHHVQVIGKCEGGGRCQDGAGVAAPAAATACASVCHGAAACHMPDAPAPAAQASSPPDIFMPPRLMFCATATPGPSVRPIPRPKPSGGDASARLMLDGAKATHQLAYSMYSYSRQDGGYCFQICTYR